ncbi:hypothetical protein M3B90_00585 [Dermabacter sp. p3-SID358]|uniref:hypothetical protein n=1 Tax=Dermabacter sp. p3-SID358 TaxID=2916114 RepID=UPI0021A29DF0|nr:hypothetical protein [Dermabacter sp. p3-SID358]MCT1866030.1 hypothetical protein [Dermabacter sp. p3-SID358]
MLVVLYVVAAFVAALGALYMIKDLPADLVLMGASLFLALVWLIGALAWLLAPVGPADAVIFWGYVATAVALPIAGVYISFLERTKWGSLAIAAIALTCVFLAYRLPQIWPEGFAK